MSTESCTHRPSRRARRAAIAAAAFVGTLTTATVPAAAQPATSSLRYTCVFPTIGGQAITARISADIPATLPVGESSPAFAIHAAATVEASFTLGLRYVLGVRTIEGSIDTETRVLAPQGETAVPVHLAITRTAVPASGAFDIPATGNAPRISFTHPGTGRVTVGNFTLHLVPKDADGNLAGPGRTDVPCTLQAGQDNTVAHFDVTPAKASPTPLPTAPPSALPRPSASSATTPAPTSASSATTAPGTDASAVASTVSASATPSTTPPSTFALTSTDAPQAPTTHPQGASLVATGIAAAIAAALATLAILHRRFKAALHRGRSG
ncbi:DUF6801 domain-containing protein [Kitasatospora sp. NPDC004289]